MFARSRRHCRSSWRRHCGGQQLARSALQLFGVIPDPKAIGTVHFRLARRAATPEEAAEHREAARKAWASIDRPDLIEQHLGKDG